MSSSDTQNFLQRFSPEGWACSCRFICSSSISHNIFSGYQRPSWQQSLFLFVMTLLNLCWLHSTEALTEFSKTVRSFFLTSGINPILCLCSRTSKLVPAFVTLPPDLVCLQKKKFRFSVLVPTTQLHWNPILTVRGYTHLSGLTVWGGVTVASTTTFTPSLLDRAIQNPLQHWNL